MGLGGGCETKPENSPGACLQCSHGLQTYSLPLPRISVAFIIAKGLPCSVEQLSSVCSGLGDYVSLV